ncbi:MAG: glutathione S-transferase [Sphingomonadales bacterium]|nr:glutathione S-transferase [Sphingomonadales bacterium]
MIDVYGPASPNVIKVLLALEELGIAYRRLPLDIMSGEQFAPAFLAISPNNKIPAIVDHEPDDGEGPLSLFESGAILIYLAEKTGRLLPVAPRKRSEVLAWLMWQMSGQGPMLGQAGHFRNYAPEPISYAIRRYTDEAARLYKVLDTRLHEREWIAGDFSIADIACWPWILFRAHHGIEIGSYPNVARWHAMMTARPSFARAMPDFVPPPPVVPDEKTRRILFNIKDE